MTRRDATRPDETELNKIARRDEFAAVLSRRVAQIPDCFRRCHGKTLNSVDLYTIFCHHVISQRFLIGQYNIVSSGRVALSCGLARLDPTSLDKTLKNAQSNIKRVFNMPKTRPDETRRDFKSRLVGSVSKFGANWHDSTRRDGQQPKIASGLVGSGRLAPGLML